MKVGGNKDKQEPRIGPRSPEDGLEPLSVSPLPSSAMQVILTRACTWPGAGEGEGESGDSAAGEA